LGIDKARGGIAFFGIEFGHKDEFANLTSSLFGRRAFKLSNKDMGSKPLEILVHNVVNGKVIDDLLDTNFASPWVLFLGSIVEILLTPQASGVIRVDSFNPEDKL